MLARIDHHDGNGLLLTTSVSGTLAPLSARRVARAFFAVPLLGLLVVARIHWQAAKLWCKRVPLLKKPAPPPLVGQ